MTIKTRATLFFFLLLSIWSLSPAKVRLTTLSIIPTADILDHKQFRLGTQGNFFAYQEDTGATPKVWATPLGGGDLGLGKRLEVGLRYGGGISLSFKGLILEDKPEDYWPSVTVGARDIMASAEGAFFGVRDRDTLDEMANEAYLALSKSIEALGLRIHAGSMTNYKIKSDRFAPFVGAEFYLGGGFYASFEGFKRFGEFRQFMAFTYRYQERLVISVGLSELKEVFYHGGSAGFRLFAKDDVLSNGYGSPGLNFSVSFYGFLPSGPGGEIRVEDRLNDMESTLKQVRTDLKGLGARLDRTDRQMTGLQEEVVSLQSPAVGVSGRDPRREIPEHLKVITDLLTDSAAYDPEELSIHIRKIAEFKQLALPSLTRILRDPTASPKLTSLCIQMIGEIGHRSSHQVLISLLDYKESGVKIDALIALGKLRDKSVATDLERLLLDADPAVATAAQKVIGNLTGETPPIPKPRPAFKDSTAAPVRPRPR